LSGDKDKAIKDFRRAAELGDRDAQAYLKDTLHGEQMDIKFEKSIIGDLRT
jgi:TPR repeat protein